MPELPEVETVVRSLNKSLSGKIIKDIKLLWRPILHKTTQENLKKKLIGKRVSSVSRRAKYIFINVDDYILAYHLRMTGRVYLSDDNNKPKHMHAIIRLNKGQLKFEDVRKFSRLYFIKNENDLSQNLGIEPLSNDFTDQWLIENLSKRKKRIKHLLFEQSFIAGLGNIYIDEVLWQSRLHPNKISSTISKAKARRLRNSIVSTLSKSIKHHGTSFRDFVFEGFRIGDYSSELKVFGHDGEPCMRCSTKIKKIKVASRGTHYCPKCQHL